MEQLKVNPSEKHDPFCLGIKVPNLFHGDPITIQLTADQMLYVHFFFQIYYLTLVETYGVFPTLASF